MVVYSFLENLSEAGDTHGAGASIPASVIQEVAGKKVPISTTYTLVGDGNFLRRAMDARWLYWDANGHFTHYEIKPGFYTVELKRLSSPMPRTAIVPPAPLGLRDNKSNPIIDPQVVKGGTDPGRPERMQADAVIAGLTADAKRLGWDDKKRERLGRPLTA